MKIAYVTDVKEYQNDGRFFVIDSGGNKVYRDSYAKDIYLTVMRDGNEIHTFDCYTNPQEVDLFLLDWLSWTSIYRLMSLGVLGRTVYFNAEPPTVIPENCEKGYRTLSKIFPYLFTANEEWANGNNIFLKPIFFDFHDNTNNEIPFSERKLVTGISANKKSKYKYELYSLREEAYSFFESKCPEEFDFYGHGWNAQKHPCYKGTVDSKAETFHHYKFAICFENTTNIKGYVTEKIYDCLCAGIVPIYKGATDVDKYVPRDCYIDFDDFSSLEELYIYISDMPKNEYMEYLTAAKRWLLSEPQNGHTAADILKVIFEMSITKRKMKIPISIELYCIFKSILERIKNIYIGMKVHVNVHKEP